MVLVLPVPALAITRLCPAGAVAAAYCSVFSLARASKIIPLQKGAIIA